MALIKSHSNYVLSKKHQNIVDGTIFERDITTIGGLNQFSAGQTPIYQSGNFIITVRNDDRISNHYNNTKWEENKDSGNTWTLSNVSGLTSEFNDENDLKIVLKQDYYDLMDFVYYGSLSELFRTSVNDIVNRFPGELYYSPQHIHPLYYTVSKTEDFEQIKSSVVLGPDSGKDVGEMTYNAISNPFNINIYASKLPPDADELKYFANGGYKNYEVFKGDDETNPIAISGWNSTYYYSEKIGKNKYITYTASTSSDEIISEETTKYYPCKGEKVADIEINLSNGDTIAISAWIGDNDIIYYFTNVNYAFHIRPLEQKYIVKFYNECSNFEKLLMNRKTTPKYKATFSVLKENDYGYYRELMDFIFPTIDGGYNIDTSSYGFNNYTLQMVDVAAFYDERFSDNLWRSMTHEAIKNFDWSYTNESLNDENEEYVLGGKKMEKALRLFAREFDEIIPYINNIKNLNRITYNERNNLPDYFLTDTLENDGWDIKLIYPYTLTEYSRNKIFNPNSYTNENQLNNCQIIFGSTCIPITRVFSQDSTIQVKPYTKNNIVDGCENGYFIACKNDGEFCIEGEEITSGNVYENYSGTTYGVIKASGDTVFDGCALSGKGITKNKIKPFTDERSYSYNEANNEFLKRLKINSKHLWRYKGTIDGVESILAMFGLVSNRMNEKLSNDKKKEQADYDIYEYTSFAKYINDPWDAVHQMYRIDWINSTKTINYDNRFVSNYNPYGSNSNMISYEGIPVAYRNVEGSYIKQGAIDEQTFTTNASDTTIFRKIDEGNALVNERRLYPNFNHDEQYDGNVYYQMNGGWLSKRILTKNAQELLNYNFQYDEDNNVVYSPYDDTFADDNEFLYKETVRNIRKTDSLKTLLSLPIDDLWDGIIVYVDNVENEVAVIDGDIFPVIQKYEPNAELKNSNGVTFSVELIKNNGYIRVGDKFFDETITVYDLDGNVNMIDLEDKPNGFVVNAYISGGSKFMCADYSGSSYSIDNFTYLSSLLRNANETNYFLLDDVNFNNAMAQRILDPISGETWTSGWRRLQKNDKDYMKVNTIVNYSKGNNPHNGNMVYDNGHEYFTYYKQLFKYAIANDLFDERCYSDYFDSIANEITKYGFSGLINSNEEIKQYDNFLINDSKIHYFGNYKKKESNGNIITIKYGDNFDYILNNDELMIGGSPYSYYRTADEVTNQIVNNKRLTIEFKLHNNWFTQKGQEEIKYIDDIIMNYLTQMIPSTTILNVVYSYLT